MGLTDNFEQPSNIQLILVIFLVSQFEILGNDANDEHC